MTITDIVNGVVSAAKAKIDATERQAAGYVEQIRDAHNKVVAAERSGHQRSLDLAIAAGELLLRAKEATKGLGKWTEWRSEYLSDIPQTTASLYMRLAKNKDRLTKPDVSTDDGRRISKGLATLTATGGLSITKAAALLTTRTRQSPTPKKKTNEEIARQYLKEVWAPDELVTVLREVRGNEYLAELSAALAKALQPEQPEEGAVEAYCCVCDCGTANVRSIREGCLTSLGAEMGAEWPSSPFSTGSQENPVTSLIGNEHQVLGNFCSGT
jgi:hypothetical protein